MVVQLMSLGPLVDALLARGYRVVGPVRRDEAIVLAELDSADALPHGWGVDAEPGRYRLRERGDRCVAWCPASIDIREEMAALAAEREES